MEIAYSFGRSVDVDGDEWIDLGPPPAPCEAAGPGATLHDEENNNPFAVSGTSKAQTNALTKPKETSEPLPEPLPEPEPEPEQVGAKSTLQQVSPEQAQKKAARLQKPRTSVSAPVSKAARSKEALMAFYLGRAKQMEAKHKQIAASPPKANGISTLMERSRPIGL